MNPMQKLAAFVGRLAEEPPFRLFTKACINRLPVSVRVKARWDVSSRPQYLAGILAAADEALHEGVKKISAYEFGVAGGNGLLAMGDIAAAVEAETGVKITVYGFDTGTGLPNLIGDYRDYPDHWQHGDYPMNEEALRKQLRPNTHLILGDVRGTVPQYLPHIREPIGFVAVDVDIYSSTCDVLRMFLFPDRKMLRRVYMYFDDVDLPFTHRFAGEMLAMDEFNRSNDGVKIDQWRSLKKLRPFPEASWLNRMYIAHDVEAISRVHSDRTPKVIEVNSTCGNTG
jgi:hypothetical protein